MTRELGLEAAEAGERVDWVERFLDVRQASLSLCETLVTEDYGVQPMADASPPKWHLAHTTWFFETFILKEWVERFEPFHPQYEYLFNSYYNGVGTPYPRAGRGNLSRPTVNEVRAYREHVDNAIAHLVQRQGADQELIRRLELGIHHEQQHQELLLTDVKYNFGHNPLYPVYRETTHCAQAPVPMAFTNFEGGLVDVGAVEAFAFDNERPRHAVHLVPFELADRLVTNREYLEFVEDGGYSRAELWLSDGWAQLQSKGWQAPLYWRKGGEGWHEYRLDGLQSLDPLTPVVHVSAYEAFAYAAWAGCRLPTEFEWEVAAQAAPVAGNFVESKRLHPAAASESGKQAMQQLYGDVWEWTSSSYGAYPGYRPLPGTLGEYNGKFMSSQLVLRGGSCATAQTQMRASYRNFFYPKDRWQFSGIRLAKG